MFQEIGRIALGRPGPEAQQQPGGGQRAALLPLAEGLMKEPPQSVAHHSTLAHLAAHHHRQPAGGGVLRLGRKQQFRAGRRHPQHHRGQALTPAAAVEVVEHSAPPQAQRAGQHHRADDSPGLRPPGAPVRGGGGPGSPGDRCGCACAPGNRTRACACGWFPQGCVWSWQQNVVRRRERGRPWTGSDRPGQIPTHGGESLTLAAWVVVSC